MALCISSTLGTYQISAAVFTLVWTHSVEKTRWEEDWRVHRGTLVLTEARVKGSGAGMEPGEGARLDAGFWRWKPTVEPLQKLVLRQSSENADGWLICTGGQCRTIGDQADSSGTVTLSVCSR